MHFSSAAGALALLTLSGVALGVASPKVYTGKASYYAGNTDGTCSFSGYTIPSGIYGTALAGPDWDTAAHCGECVAVTGPTGKVITAMIVDECTGCAGSSLNLFQDAFVALAPLVNGNIRVDWEYVDCPITSSLKLHNDQGVGSFYFSMQVVNSAKAIDTMDVSYDKGKTWHPTVRKSYNFFQNITGFGTDVVDIMLTTTDGSVLTIDNVLISPNLSIDVTTNFQAAVSSPPPAPSAVTSTVLTTVYVTVGGSSTKSSTKAKTTTTKTTSSSKKTSSAAPSTMTVNPVDTVFTTILVGGVSRSASLS